MAKCFKCACGFAFIIWSGLGAHMTIITASFFSGITLATFAASSVFFLKFWKASRDPFFLYFCIASLLLAIERIVVVLLYYIFEWMSPEDENGSWIYIIRLSAFALMSLAVYQKNRADRKL